MKAEKIDLSDYLAYNINHDCVLKPTQEGKEAFIFYWHRQWGYREDAVKRLEENLDPDGYMKMTLGQVFEIFGPFMFEGSTVLYVGEFYIKSRWLR